MVTPGGWDQAVIVEQEVPLGPNIIRINGKDFDTKVKGNRKSELIKL